jgi:hypothetical protein
MADPGRQNPLEGLPLAVLAGIGGGVAGLTFFTFVGGAIVVARLRGAGLSGTKAVALVPKADLLAVGAQAMLLPTMIGLVVVVLFVVCDRSEKARMIVLAIFALLGLDIAVRLVDHQWSVSQWNADEKEAMVAFGLLVLAGAFAVYEMAQQAGRASAAILLFLVVVLAAAVVSYAMGYAKPSVHPMAVVFADGSGGMSGIYVGDTDNRVWIGHVEEDDNSGHGIKKQGRIVELPRSQITSVAIGASLGLDDAIKAGPRLLTALQTDHAVISPVVGH